MFSITIGIVGMVAFVLLAILIVWIGINQLGKPILQLHEAVVLIGQGRFDPDQLRSLTGREDEIGHLARGLIEMGMVTQQRYDLLQDKADALRSRIAQME